MEQLWVIVGIGFHIISLDDLYNAIVFLPNVESH